MRQQTAQVIFVTLNILAVPAVIYPIYEYFRIKKMMGSGATVVSFDTGDFYFFLLSIFWVLLLLQYAGLHGMMVWVKRTGSMLLIGWFIGCLVLAYLLPRWLGHSLQQAGYQKCENDEQLSRLSRGENVTYHRSFCSTNTKLE